MNKKITQQCNVFSHQQTNSTSLQNTKFQPVDISDEGSIYRCPVIVWVSSGFLISVIPLIVLSSTWRFHWSLTHCWENPERQMSHEKFLEDSMIIHLANCPYHLSILAHHTPQKAIPIFIAPGYFSSQYASHLAHGAVYMVQFWLVLSSFSGGTSGKWCNQLAMIL